MKRINFEYRVSTNVLLNRVDILAIQKVGMSHYDGKCKDFANKRCAYWLMDWEESEPSREMTFTEPVKGV